MKKNVIISCAVTGAGDTVGKHPDIPVTPEQIASAAIEAANAGAAIAHMHVRDPETGKGTRDNELYKEVVSRIKDSGTDVIINLTSGMGGDIEIGPENNLFEFTVYYNGIPQNADNPPWAGGFTWSKDKNGRDWVAVSCEGEGARIWWPNKDHITAEGDSVRMVYTVPSSMIAVGNGNLRNIDKNGAKDVANTLKPSSANPAATPIRFCSLIPTDKY